MSSLSPVERAKQLPRPFVLLLLVLLPVPPSPGSQCCLRSLGGRGDARSPEQGGELLDAAFNGPTGCLEHTLGVTNDVTSFVWKETKCLSQHNGVLTVFRRSQYFGSDNQINTYFVVCLHGNVALVGCTDVMWELCERKHEQSSWAQKSFFLETKNKQRGVVVYIFISR